MINNNNDIKQYYFKPKKERVLKKPALLVMGSKNKMIENIVDYYYTNLLIKPPKSVRYIVLLNKEHGNLNGFAYKLKIMDLKEKQIYEEQIPKFYTPYDIEKFVNDFSISAIHFYNPKFAKGFREFFVDMPSALKLKIFYTFDNTEEFIDYCKELKERIEYAKKIKSPISSIKDTIREEKIKRIIYNPNLYSRIYNYIRYTIEWRGTILRREKYYQSAGANRIIIKNKNNIESKIESINVEELLREESVDVIRALPNSVIFSSPISNFERCAFYLYEDNRDYFYKHNYTIPYPSSAIGIMLDEKQLSKFIYNTKILRKKFNATDDKIIGAFIDFQNPLNEKEIWGTIENLAQEENTKVFIYNLRNHKKVRNHISNLDKKLKDRVNIVENKSLESYLNLLNLYDLVWIHSDMSSALNEVILTDSIILNKPIVMNAIPNFEPYYQYGAIYRSGDLKEAQHLIKTLLNDTQKYKAIKDFQIDLMKKDNIIQSRNPYLFLENLRKFYNKEI